MTAATLPMLILFAIGGAAGWLAGGRPRRHLARSNNVVAGILGALFGGLMVSPLIGAPPMSGTQLLVGAASAAVIVATLRLLRECVDQWTALD